MQFFPLFFTFSMLLIYVDNTIHKSFPCTVPMVSNGFKGNIPTLAI